jgi:hypothetical protein
VGSFLYGSTRPFLNTVQPQAPCRAADGITVILAGFSILIGMIVAATILKKETGLPVLEKGTRRY